MDDPAYRKELGNWIGIGALGDPWLKARIGQAVVTYLDIGDREAKKNSKLIQSAPAIGVLTTESDAPPARVKTGQIFERMALTATAEGIAVHPMSQILERPAMREELASLIDEDDKLPQHLCRLGYPPRRARPHPSMAAGGISRRIGVESVNRSTSYNFSDVLSKCCCIDPL